MGGLALHIVVDGVAEFLGFAGRATGDAVGFLLHVDDQGRFRLDVHLVDALDGDRYRFEQVLFDFYPVPVDLRFLSDSAFGNWFVVCHCASPEMGNGLIMDSAACDSG